MAVCPVRRNPSAYVQIPRPRLARARGSPVMSARPTFHVFITTVELWHGTTVHARRDPDPYLQGSRRLVDRVARRSPGLAAGLAGRTGQVGHPEPADHGRVPARLRRSVLLRP